MQNLSIFLFVILACFSCNREDPAPFVPPPVDPYPPCQEEGSLLEINGDWEITHAQVDEFTAFTQIKDLAFTSDGTAFLIGDDIIWKMNTQDLSVEQLPEQFCQPHIICSASPSDLYLFTLNLTGSNCPEENSEFYRSFDEGESWEKVPLPGNFYVYDAHFIDPLKGFAIMTIQGTYLYSTIDGGLSWSVHDSLPGYFEPLKTIHFVNDELGMINGEGNNVYLTTNGGETWNIILGTEEGLKNPQFIDEQNGFAIGGILFGGDVISYGRQLYQTKNGGLSWTRILNSTVYGYHFIDEMNGIAYLDGEICQAENRAYFLKTTKTTSDGGITWETSPGHMFDFFPSLHFRTATEGFLFEGQDVYRLEYKP